MGKYQLKILPDNISVEIDDKTSILKASLRAGISHAHACGGNARCSTCRVIVTAGKENLLERNEKEWKLVHKLGFPPHIRLACQTKVRGNVEIKRPIIDAFDLELALAQVDAENLDGQVGCERNIGVLFFDIEEYTPFAEKQLPYDVIHVLNKYYALVGRSVQANNGHIIDYYGDGILAVFGLEQQESPVLDAVRSAFDMQEALKEFNAYLTLMFDHQFKVRMGLHFGKVIVGKVGIDGAYKFAVIGDTINVANRIEEINKQFGTYFLISEDAYRQVENHVQVNKTYHTALKGKSGSFTLFEVVGIREAR